jgi:hypothetical protein
MAGVNSLTLNELMQKHPQIQLDPEDKAKFGFWTSYITCGYIKTYYLRTQKLLHLHITTPPEGYQVDHINRNKLDNRKDNLRISTIAQNCANKDLMSNNTSGHKGVYWNKANQKWHARIMYQYHGHKMYKHLGYFEEILDAVAAYESAAKLYNKEYAANNSTIVLQ